MNVYAIHGRFGAYVQLGETPEKGSKEKPKRSSLAGSMTESTVTLDEALKLLELPRELGVAPGRGRRLIVAGLGRFGPYVKHGDDYRSLEADRRSVHRRSRRAPSRCSRRRSAPRVRRRSGSFARSRCQTAARRFRCSKGGSVPTSPTAKPTRRFREAADPATISLEEAQALLEARRGAPPREPRRGRRGGAVPRGRGRRKVAPVERVAVKPASAAKAKARPRPRSRRRRSRSRRPVGKARGPQARELMAIRIIGGGLAGCEAAWQAASRGVPVTLYEMRPVAADRRAQDRPARRTGLQQLVPRRQAR